MWPTGSRVKRVFLVAGLLLLSLHSFTQENVLDSPLNLPGNSTRASRALSEVSRLTGYLFTYDTRIIDADRSFTIPRYDMTVREILDSVTGDPSVRYSVMGRHIILYREVVKPPAADTLTEPLSFFISGKITDAETSEPLPYATIGISHRGRGTVTNFNGDFILRISEEYLDDTLSISYVG
ncbi:MAG: carboxypeptidase-like regulatory domain-containing protein, partial [Bacteroidales bacterium]